MLEVNRYEEVNVKTSSGYRKAVVIALFEEDETCNIKLVDSIDGEYKIGVVDACAFAWQDGDKVVHESDVCWRS